MVACFHFHRHLNKRIQLHQIKSVFPNLLAICRTPARTRRACLKLTPDESGSSRWERMWLHQGSCCSQLQLITALGYSLWLNKLMMVCFCLFHFAFDNSSPHTSTKVLDSVPAPGSCVEVAGSPQVGGLQVPLNSPRPRALLGDSHGAC